MYNLIREEIVCDIGLFQWIIINRFVEIVPSHKKKKGWDIDRV